MYVNSPFCERPFNKLVTRLLRSFVSSADFKIGFRWQMTHAQVDSRYHLGYRVNKKYGYKKIITSELLRLIGIKLRELHVFLYKKKS